MLSIEKCRKILGPTCSLSDSQIEQFRDSLTALAELSFQAYRKNPKTFNKTRLFRNSNISFLDLLKGLSEMEKEEAIERAAIMEFEGGLSREEAERAALRKYIENEKGN